MFYQYFWDIDLFGCFKSRVESFMGFDDDFETSWEEGVDLVHVEERIRGFSALFERDEVILKEMLHAS